MTPYSIEATREQATRSRKYEIRDADGRAVRGWDDPTCTPDKSVLKSMKDHGYRLFIDGKKQR